MRFMFVIALALSGCTHFSNLKTNDSHSEQMTAVVEAFNKAEFDDAIAKIKSIPEARISYRVRNCPGLSHTAYWKFPSYPKHALLNYARSVKKVFDNRVSSCNRSNPPSLANLEAYSTCVNKPLEKEFDDSIYVRKVHAENYRERNSDRLANDLPLCGKAGDTSSRLTSWLKTHAEETSATIRQQHEAEIATQKAKVEDERREMARKFYDTEAGYGSRICSRYEWMELPKKRLAEEKRMLREHGVADKQVIYLNAQEIETHRKLIARDSLKFKQQFGKDFDIDDCQKYKTVERKLAH